MNKAINKIMQQGHILAQTEIYLGKVMTIISQVDEERALSAIVVDETNYPIKLSRLHVIFTNLRKTLFGWKFDKGGIYEELVRALHKAGLKTKLKVDRVNEDHTVEGVLWIIIPKKY